MENKGNVIFAESRLGYQEPLVVYVHVYNPKAILKATGEVHRVSPPGSTGQN